MLLTLIAFYCGMFIWTLFRGLLFLVEPALANEI